MTNKTWIVGGALGLLVLGSFAQGIPQRTVRWYTQVAAWEAAVTADSLARVRQDSADAVQKHDLAVREARVAERERRDSATALVLASRIAALPSSTTLPDTCQPAVRARDSVIQAQGEQLVRKDSTIVDLIGQVRGERSLRLRLEEDTTEMSRELREAKGLIRTAPVRISLWERLRPSIYAGFGAAGGPSGVQTGAAVLVGWKIR
ncbi:MAG TPA: hypothetical protein VFI41_12755 [Gemmatimonadales bacterium]|nr:hypothetical protein [Gemmatimonadales bacterium]